ncbi:MAG: hypothetical protein GYA36_16560 [Veillonellaceae bacterium]|nr:hypothetical protein [Veillonellaceae bacterium]
MGDQYDIERLEQALARFKKALDATKGRLDVVKVAPKGQTLYVVGRDRPLRQEVRYE